MRSLRNISHGAENSFPASIELRRDYAAPDGVPIIIGARAAMVSSVPIREFLNPDSATISASLIHFFVSYCRNDNADRDEGRVRAYRTCICVRDIAHRVHVQRQ